MLAFVYTLVFIFAGESGLKHFYDDYLNIPGFEAWKFINLGIFIAVMVYLIKKPLSDAFLAKRDAIRAELIKAEEEKQAALAKLTATEAKLAQLEAEKETVLSNAKSEAAAEKKRISDLTKQDIERLRQQSEGEITRLSQQARVELRRYSAEESVRLAEQKLKSMIDAKTDGRLVKANIKEIGGLN